MSSVEQNVWFITGCSTGFGAALAREVLSRGDIVIATARNAAKLKDLERDGATVMQFDVTDSSENLKRKAEEAHSLYGRINYLINNAGYSLQGTFEELTPEEIQAQFDTNVFGLLNVTRAFLPYLRAQRSGVIANVSSLGAWGGFPAVGAYTSSKWTVSGISETMTLELADFGIKVCSVEPGYFRSNFLNPGNRKTDESRIADYDGTAARKIAALMDEYDNKQPGDVKKGVRVMVDVLTGKTGKDIPLRLPLGTDCYNAVKQKCEDTLALLEEWKDLITSTDHDDVRS